MLSNLVAPTAKGITLMCLKPREASEAHLNGITNSFRTPIEHNTAPLQRQNGSCDFRK
jgi:hypothetical protein